MTLNATPGWRAPFDREKPAVSHEFLRGRVLRELAVAKGNHTNNHAFSSANIAARRMAAISFRKLLISSSLSHR